jgi:hypothetical protein
VFVLMLFVTEPWESGMKRSTEPEIHPTAVWAKFKSMAEGGRLASREVWAVRLSAEPKPLHGKRIVAGCATNLRAVA